MSQNFVIIWEAYELKMLKTEQRNSLQVQHEVFYVEMVPVL